MKKKEVKPANGYKHKYLEAEYLCPKCSESVNIHNLDELKPIRCRYHAYDLKPAGKVMIIEGSDIVTYQVGSKEVDRFPASDVDLTISSRPRFRAIVCNNHVELATEVNRITRNCFDTGATVAMPDGRILQTFFWSGPLSKSVFSCNPYDINR